MAATAATKRKRQQRQAGIRLVILLAILVCVNILTGFFHYGLDLTRDKRFTLSKPTKEMLRNMDDVAVITIYLNGNKLPAEWKRLQQSVRDKLNTFKEFAGTKVVYRFLDPFEGKSDMEQMATYKELGEKGIYFLPVQVGDNQSNTQIKVFPFALVQYKGKEMSVSLLETHTGMSMAAVLNYSESLLEYKFASTIYKLSVPDKPRVGYIVGHGEPLNLQSYDALSTLSKYYYIDTIYLPETYYISTAEDVIIVSKPTQPIPEKDQFKIDQYVMNGGHVLWSLDALNVPMDSLMSSATYLATDYGLGLDDMLFKYGVRLNPDLIEDRKQRLEIPLSSGYDENGKPVFKLYPWTLLPLFTPTSQHPVVKNLDAIKGLMAGSIDTIENDGIQKTILLSSSQNSRPTPSPVRINLAAVAMGSEQPYSMYNKPKPVAVLLEGMFTSPFYRRLDPRFLAVLQDSLKRPFKARADKPGKMIVVSDGDMFLNDVSSRVGPLDMGDWQYSQPPERYANKAFFLNCVEYLTSNSGLLEARSKNVHLRLLDADRVQQEKSTWQILNVGLPVLIILIFASVYLFFRKRKYEK